MESIKMITPPPPETFKDRVLAYLYKTYPQHSQVIEKYIIAIENVDTDKGPETQWEYWIREDGTLHTPLLDEDFNYYRGHMYPDQLYDI